MLLIAFAVAAHLSGLDLRIEDAFFDLRTGRFPWRSHVLIESLGHQGLRALLTGVWTQLAAATVVAWWHAPWRPWRHLLLATTAGMALGPLLVVVLKSLTTFPCPWSLVRYGGFAQPPAHWFTNPAMAGHCFPAGHSAGGFSLVAIGLCLWVAGRPRLAGWALAAALLIGSLATLTRLAQGAHFLSHGRWAAAIDWLVAALMLSTSRIKAAACAV